MQKQDIMMEVVNMDKIGFSALLLAFVILLSSLVPGCVEKTGVNEKWIYQIRLKIPTEPQEVSLINSTYVKTEMEKRGYIVAIQDGTNNFTKGIMCNKNRTFITLFISTDLNASEIFYDETNSFKELELNIHKNTIQNEINTTAQICNLTLDWNKVAWSYSYVD